MSKFSQKRHRSVGEVSSKYGYDRTGEQFEADIQRHVEEGEVLYSEFVEWMKAHDVTPDKFRALFGKYYDEYVK